MVFTSSLRVAGWRLVVVCCIALETMSVSFAQVAPAQPYVEEIRQQERERALQDEQKRDVDERLQKPVSQDNRRLPANESPCFRIHRIEFDGEHADDFRFRWVFAAMSGPDWDDSPIGRCMGTESINIVLSRIQQAMIKKGYVTTRILAAPQDLSQGVLKLTLVPGRITAIRFEDGTTRLGNAIPAEVGDLLNIRDIEQGLENLKRVPTAEADIQIYPSQNKDARPGDSELVIKYAQPRHWRGNISLDDSGTKATGKNQIGATLSLDNLLGLNDLFYFSATHNFDNDGLGSQGKSNGSRVINYSLPYGYWLLGFAASDSNYRQNIAGLTQTYIYAGSSSNAELKLSRLLYRDQNSKTTASLRGWRRTSRNFIDDTEIGVQRRAVGGWELGFNQREFIGAATLDANLSYRQGTGAFGALTAPEELFGEGTSRMRIINADATLNLPFALSDQKLRYSGAWRAQWNRTLLTPQDMFAIGGRYSVRGFDGEANLMGDSGWLIRNDLGLALGQTGMELYTGIDYGEIGGELVDQLIGRRLTGGVMGLRGVYKQVNYDLFAGGPIRKPNGFHTASALAGFNLNFGF